MQASAAAQPSPYANRVYKSRKCEDCPVIIQPRSSGQKRCEDCQRLWTLKIRNASQAAATKARYKPRFCADCGIEIPRPEGRSRPRVRCVPCAEARLVAYHRARNKQRSADGSRKVWDARWRDSHREAINEASRQYRLAHPEVDQAAIHRRRQRADRRMDATDRLLSAAYRIAIRDDPCFYCGSAGQETDHYFPLSKGGTDHWFNLVRACRKCNRGPGGKLTKCGTAYMLRRGDWRPGSLPVAA